MSHTRCKHGIPQPSSVPCHFCENENLRADLAAAKADAERWNYVKDRAEWFRYPADDRDPGYAMLCVRLPYDADLSCKAMREDAIDAAIAGSKT